MGLENVCRLCRLTTSKPEELSSLFENELNEKLFKSYAILVQFDENLPTKVCPICKSIIEQSSHFKNRCEDTNSYFDGYLRKKMQMPKSISNQGKNKVLSISSPNITSRVGSPKTSRALPYQEKVGKEVVNKPMSPKISKPIPLPYPEPSKQEHYEISDENQPLVPVVRQVSRQYTRKQKPSSQESNSGPTRTNIVLFGNQHGSSPMKIKEEPQSVVEMLTDDWSDEGSPGSPITHSPKQRTISIIKTEVTTPVKHSSYQLDCERIENEWNEDDETVLTIKSEPYYGESYETRETQVQTPKKRIIGEEVVVENHCNMLAVYNGGKTPSNSSSTTSASSNKRSYNSDNVVLKKIPNTYNKKIRFHCTECSSGFTDEMFLLSHACGNLRYACYICKKVYKNEYALVKHMGEHQNNSERSFNKNQEEFKEETDENVYSSGNYIRMESTHKRQKTMYFKDN